MKLLRGPHLAAALRIVGLVFEREYAISSPIPLMEERLVPHFLKLSPVPRMTVIVRYELHALTDSRSALL